MPTPDPNPSLYPPNTGQSYVQVHAQDLKGIGSFLYIKTITNLSSYYDTSTPPVLITEDNYPAGTSWTATAKYQIHRGSFGLVWVPSQTAPYTTFSSSGSGYPLAFSTYQAAQNALTQSTNSVPEGYKFYGRNPRFEIAQTIEAYKANSEEFAEADTAITAHLTSRAVTAANSFYAYYSAKLVNQDSNNQFVLGLCAASGGGQNTTYLANSLSVMQLQEAANNALTAAQAVPIVVPFESPLISDSHASAVEAKNAGEIRDQQIRQTLTSASGVQRGWDLALERNYSWEGASIVMGAFGQSAAASQT